MIHVLSQPVTIVTQIIGDVENGNDVRQLI